MDTSFNYFTPDGHTAFALDADSQGLSPRLAMYSAPPGVNKSVGRALLMVDEKQKSVALHLSDHRTGHPRVQIINDPSTNVFAIKDRSGDNTLAHLGLGDDSKPLYFLWDKQKGIAAMRCDGLEFMHSNGSLKKRY